MKSCLNGMIRAGSITVAEALFYLAFCIYFMLSGFQRTEYLASPGDAFESAKAVLQIVIIGLLLLKALFQKIRIERWAIAGVLIAIGFLTWRSSGTAWLFWAVIFIVFGYGIDIKKLARIAFAMAAFLLAVTVGGAVLGVIPNTAFVREGVIRYGMGFIHPNFLGLFCSVLCASFSVARFGRPPLPDFVLLAASSVFVSFLSDSRSSILLMVLQAALLVIFALSKTEKTRHLFRRCFVVLFVGLILASLYFMVFYNPGNPLHAALNNVLSGRLYFMNGYFKLAPFSLFGNSYEGFMPIYWENGKSEPFVVDNAYCHLFLHFGVIAFTVFVAAYLFALRDLNEKRAWDCRLFLLVLMAVYSFTETVGLQIETNYALLVLSAFLFEKAGERSGLPEKEPTKGVMGDYGKRK